jgi:hypothetical protein
MPQGYECKGKNEAVRFGNFSQKRLVPLTVSPGFMQSFLKPEEE